MARSSLPKLMRPRSDGMLPRERLFQSLDECRNRPAVWVAGPPGAGKTMLVASYTESRALPTLWYQWDSGDSDPATWFRHLRAAAPSRHFRLAAFAPENSGNLASYARRFFRALFDRVGASGLVVLDNIPALQGDVCVRSVLREAIQEVPRGFNLFVISRDPAPPEFAGLQLRGLIATLGWDSLRLTREESAKIAADAGIDDVAVSALHTQCDGWVVALRLLLERYRRTGRPAFSMVAGRSAALFGYLASEIFEQLPEETRTVLLRTSFLPEVDKQSAEALTGNSRACVLLEQLSARQLLVDRLEGKRPRFQYHALFREFLCDQARKVLVPAQYRALQRQCAQLLIGTAQSDYAIPLLAQAGDWSAAARRILLEAPHLLANGQSQTVTAWVNTLPSWYVATTPRLMYCLGLAQRSLDLNNARATFERAHALFQQEDNLLGQALAAAAIVHADYLRFDDFLGTEHWVEILQALLDLDVNLPTPEIELHIRSMLQLAMSYVTPTSGKMAANANTILQLLSRGLEANQCVAAASVLLPYYEWFAPDKASALIAMMESPARSSTLTPYNKMSWLLSLGYHHGHHGDNEAMKTAFAQARTVAAESGLHATASMIGLIRAFELIACNQPKQCMLQLAKTMEELAPGRRQEQVLFHQLAAQAALLTHDAARALDHAKRAMLLCQETGHRASELETLGLTALALCELGDGQGALKCMQQAREMTGQPQRDKLAFHHMMIEAYAQLVSGSTSDALVALSQGLCIGREHGYTKGFYWIPHIASRLCQEALQAGIEPHHVKKMIEQHCLELLSVGPCDAWPWPVKVYVLGTFELQVNGIPLSVLGKAQKKPLELLKVLVAKGATGAHQELLAQELWPDSEGDAALSALRMTLHRLRKLLGRDEAAKSEEGRVRLSSAVCWVDAWAFESACLALERSDESASGEPTAIDVATALRLYRGPAFGGEAGFPWMMPARDRWHSKFLATVTALGMREENSGQYEAALTRYWRGIEADPLCEELYRRLMRCYLLLGRPAEAYRAYRRCRDALSITLGVCPSAPTEALRQEAARQGASSASRVEP